MSINKTLTAALSALAMMAAAGVAQAQDSGAAPAPEMAPPAAAAPSLDDGKLKSFAVAFLEVAKVGEAYKGRIEGASGQEQEQLQQEAGEKMVEAVNAQGDISVDEYNQIIAQAQADPQLAQRINGHINEAATGQAPAAPTE